MGQRNLDINGYYSDVNAKYVTHHDKSRGRFFNDGKRALSNGLAIAAILNRTLILPKFQHPEGGEKECPLNCFVRITIFDQHFKNRESDFLNRLVPADMRNAESVYNVSTKVTSTWQQHVDDLQVLNTLGKIASPVFDMGEALAKTTVTFKNKANRATSTKAWQVGWWKQVTVSIKFYETSMT